MPKAYFKNAFRVYVPNDGMLQNLQIGVCILRISVFTNTNSNISKNIISYKRTLNAHKPSN